MSFFLDLSATGRMDLDPDAARVEVHGTGRLRRLVLAKLETPKIDDGEIIVEISRHGRCERFPFGPASAFRPGTSVPIPENLDDEGAFAVVKIVGPGGRILARRDKRAVSGRVVAEDDADSILHVRYEEGLGERVWKLDLDGSWPTVVINGSEDRETYSSPEFRAYAIPEIAERILEIALADPEAEDESEWKGAWRNFARKTLGTTSLPCDAEDETPRETARKIADVICAKNRLRSLLQKGERQ
jgi:hypothetical protein